MPSRFNLGSAGQDPQYRAFFNVLFLQASHGGDNHDINAAHMGAVTVWSRNRVAHLGISVMIPVPTKQLQPLAATLLIV